MITAKIQFIIYITVLVFAIWISLKRLKGMELSLKFICMLLGYTLITEILAAYMAVRYRQNLMIYHIYPSVSLAFIALYYNYSIKEFRQYKIGYFVAGFGFLAAILNTLYLQPLKVMDSNVTLLAGVLIVMMAILSFYKIYMDENNLRFARTPHFWLSVLFLFYYCTTFFLFGLMQYCLMKKMHTILQGMYWFLWSVNLIFYTGIGVIFLLTVSRKKYYGR